MLLKAGEKKKKAGKAPEAALEVTAFMNRLFSANDQIMAEIDRYNAEWDARPQSCCATGEILDELLKHLDASEEAMTKA
jgi:hypothetical protein